MFKNILMTVVGIGLAATAIGFAAGWTGRTEANCPAGSENCAKCAACCGELCGQCCGAECERCCGDTAAQRCGNAAARCAAADSVAPVPATAAESPAARGCGAGTCSANGCGERSTSQP